MTTLHKLKINPYIPTSIAISNNLKDDLEIKLADLFDIYLEQEIPENPVILTMNVTTLSFLQRLIPENWKLDPITHKRYYTNIEVIINPSLKDGIIKINTLY